MTEQRRAQDLLRIHNFPRNGNGDKLANLLADIAGREFRRSGQRRSVYLEFANDMAVAVGSRFPLSQSQLPAMAVTQAFVLARSGGVNRAKMEELQSMCASIVFVDIQ